MGIEVAAALAAASMFSTAQQQEQQIKIAEQNAKAAEFDAQKKAEKTKKDFAKLKSKQKAGYGASGVLLEGTPAEVLAQTDLDAELSAMDILYSGKSEADLYRNQAQNIEDNAPVNTLLSGVNTFASAYSAGK